MEQIIKLIVLSNGKNLISQIDEVGSADIGQPDCKLIHPFVVDSNKTLSPFLCGLTKENTFMMSSDKILTLADPLPTLLEKYEELID